MACVFCEIVAGRRAADIIYQDETVIAFRDIMPQAPVHVLIIPREHVTGPLAVDANYETVVGHMVSAAADVARMEGIAEDGYRLVLNQGRDGGQSVFHIHLHLLGGRRMKWPPG